MSVAYIYCFCYVVGALRLFGLNAEGEWVNGPALSGDMEGTLLGKGVAISESQIIAPSAAKGIAGNFLYLFENSGNVWSYQASLRDDEGAANNIRFGQFTSMQDDVAFTASTTCSSPGGR